MIEPKTQEAILAEYERDAGLYQDLSSRVSFLLEQMLKGASIQIHSITQRSKSRSSLAGKLNKSDKTYSKLSDITDLSAVRITTYFAEDVDTIAKIIENEFSIDPTNSIDKRALLDPDRFGYQSLHYVATISEDRCRFVEYSRFASQKFEIQVRSILQHAWAEIEHDLGYKSAAGIPRDIRRRFSRIAGLLELADDEFSTIRKLLDAYAAGMPREIQEQPDIVGIDKISLQTLVSSENSTIHFLSNEIAKMVGATLEPASDYSLEHDVNILERVNIRTIATLEDSAKSRFNIIEQFSKEWLEGSTYDKLSENIGIFYLWYVILAETGDITQIRESLDQANIGGNNERSEAATKILQIYRNAKALHNST